MRTAEEIASRFLNPNGPRHVSAVLHIGEAQKEAYAEGRRSALEEAAAICDSPYRDAQGDSLRACAAAIRDLAKSSRE